MRRLLFISLLSIFFLKCSSFKIQKTKHWNEKLRVGKNENTLKRINVPLGEIDKFYINLCADRITRDNINFSADVFFTDSFNRKNEKLYFILCNQLNLNEYLPTDTILSCNKNGRYNFNLQYQDLKNKKLIVFLENWAGYIFE